MTRWPGQVEKMSSHEVQGWLSGSIDLEPKKCGSNPMCTQHPICFEKSATAGPYNLHVCDWQCIVLCGSWVEDGQDLMGQNIGQLIEMTRAIDLLCY